MSSVIAYSYTQSVTYVTDKILKSLKDIIVLSGLDPSAFVGKWESYSRAVRTWLESGHLEMVTLEIYHPTTGKLIKRWDISIVYGAASDGSFWTDTDQLRYAIAKEGLLPGQVKYRLMLDNKPGYPAVDGWSTSDYLSTEGMVRQSLGGTVEHNGLGGQAAYWRTR